MSAFVLNHAVVTAAGATPDAWMLVLHGIFGSGGNWRTFSRKLARRRPEWGLVLVDLRMHGGSQGAPPPHTLAAAADDVAALAGSLTDDGKPVRAVCGHSFGGKVALAHRAVAGPDLEVTWVLDSSPSARPAAMAEADNTVVSVLRTLESAPPRFADRAAFTAAVEADGHGAAIAQWLAMNLDRDPTAGDYTLRLDPAALRALLTDYYARDLWSAVTAGPGQVRAIAAGRSSALSSEDRTRFAALARADDRVAYAELADAGHWLHVDALPALVAEIAGALPAR